MISLLGGGGEVTVPYGIPYEMSQPATGIEDDSPLKVPVVTSSDTTQQQLPRVSTLRLIARLSKNYLIDLGDGIGPVLHGFQDVKHLVAPPADESHPALLQFEGSLTVSTQIK